ncbi:MAG: sulfurtransferase complex subunit TusB [Chlorobiaceae bacterium]|nr:sulfurtransferase complex subunit TusB [Chlorobiaceae bacterium]NTW11219.1 sulfurtransferase complex subunit TusB [Chlorobiaceae bacterium]
MLHTINKSPFESNILETCLRFVQPGDPILFIENGVYAVQLRSRFAPLLESVRRINPVYALQPDLSARGINALLDGVKTVDYEGFVDLVEKHKVNNWL